MIGETDPGAEDERRVFASVDHRREALDPDATLWHSLTGDPGMRVSGNSDQVMVRGTPRHVVGYLKDFLFSEAQARAPAHVSWKRYPTPRTVRISSGRAGSASTNGAPPSGSPAQRNS